MEKFVIEVKFKHGKVDLGKRIICSFDEICSYQKLERCIRSRVSLPPDTDARFQYLENGTLYTLNKDDNEVQLMLLCCKQMEGTVYKKLTLHIFQGQSPQVTF